MAEPNTVGSGSVQYAKKNPHGETCLWMIQKELVFEIRQCLCFDLSHVVSTHNFSRLGAQHSFCTVTQNRLHAVQFDLQWTLKQLWLPKDITRRHADTKLGQETDVSELGSKLFKDQKLYDHSSVEPSRRVARPPQACRMRGAWPTSCSQKYSIKKHFLRSKNIFGKHFFGQKISKIKNFQNSKNRVLVRIWGIPYKSIILAVDQILSSPHTFRSTQHVWYTLRCVLTGFNTFVHT